MYMQLADQNNIAIAEILGNKKAISLYILCAYFYNYNMLYFFISEIL